MIHVEYAVPVRASRTVAWRLLREKVESPQRFLPRVVACEVTERLGDVVVRKMTFDDGNAVTERVVLLPEQEVIFHFVDHPKFDGELRNVLFQTDEELWLAFYFRGQTKPGVEVGPADFDQLRDGFARAVMLAARQIEDGERAALELS